MRAECVWRRRDGATARWDPTLLRRARIGWRGEQHQTHRCRCSFIVRVTLAAALTFRIVRRRSSLAVSAVRIFGRCRSGSCVVNSVCRGRVLQRLLLVLVLLGVCGE
jgi:hypothetical protein